MLSAGEERHTEVDAFFDYFLVGFCVSPPSPRNKKRLRKIYC